MDRQLTELVVEKLKDLGFDYDEGAYSLYSDISMDEELFMTLHVKEKKYRGRMVEEFYDIDIELDTGYCDMRYNAYYADDDDDDYREEDFYPIAFDSRERMILSEADFDKIVKFFKRFREIDIETLSVMREEYSDDWE